MNILTIILKSTGKFAFYLITFLIAVYLSWSVWSKTRDNEKKIHDFQTELMLQRKKTNDMLYTNKKKKQAIDSLKLGSLEMIEEKARSRFGMLATDETFYEFNSVTESQ